MVEDVALWPECEAFCWDTPSRGKGAVEVWCQIRSLLKPKHSKPPFVQRTQTGLVSSRNTQPIRIADRPPLSVIWSNGADLTAFYSALSAGIATFATAWNTHHARITWNSSQLLSWPVLESSSAARAIIPFGVTATYITWAMGLAADKSYGSAGISADLAEH